MHVFSKRSFLCRHIAGICSIFITGFLPGICSKFLAGFLLKFLAHIPGRIPASNLVQIPGRIPANLNISLQIPQGVHTDSCHNLYKKNQTVNMIPARNLVSFSCGNTAVFLLDNFVQAMLILFVYNNRVLTRILKSRVKMRYMYFQKGWILSILFCWGFSKRWSQN